MCALGANTIDDRQIDFDGRALDAYVIYSTLFRATIKMNQIPGAWPFLVKQDRAACELIRGSEFINA
jgi:hypothetical protein